VANHIPHAQLMFALKSLLMVFTFISTHSSIHILWDAMDKDQLPLDFINSVLQIQEHAE
jgi:hypothetical protein